MAKKQDTISIGFEEKIWKAADILRGNLSASQYEGVVLGLIFLKYISDRFEQKFQELQGDEYADPEDKDEYTAENIFFVPAEARWSKISAAAHTPEIGVVIDEALTAIERENESLKGILPKNFARPELDKRRLGDVVDLFTNIEMHDAGEEKDLRILSAAVCQPGGQEWWRVLYAFLHCPHAGRDTGALRGQSL